MRALGVDPGLAHMGVAVVETVEGELPRVLDAYVVGTKKTTSKSRKVVDDDIDRMNLLWLNLHESAHEFQPNCVGIETYTVFKPGQGGQGKGAGWKALYAFAMAAAIGFEHKIDVFSFRPSDMKRQITGVVTASKDDVEDAVRAKVQNLDEFLSLIPSNNREHAADAVGHALCALTRMQK